MDPPSRPKGSASLQQPSGTQSAESSRTVAGESGHRWTFLSNHSHVLILLHQHPEIVMREVAQRVGITERAVQRIVLDLVEGGFLKREKVGRHNRYRIVSDQQLRHPIEAHRQIGDLLGLISPEEASP